MNRDKREVRRKLRILRHAEETGRPCQYALGAPTNTCRCLRLDLDLSRFRAAPIAHLCSLCFEGQGAFPAEC